MNGERARRDALVALAAIHVLVSVFGVVPGHVSIDEAIYHLTTRDFTATGGFGIWTGYSELPSPELVHHFLSVHAGRPVSQYPYLFPALAAPLYALMGYRGLFVLNALCFLGVVALCHALARKLFRDPVLALDACLVFVLATFAWEYSQAAWPHMASLLFTTGALHLAVTSLGAESRRAAAGAALAAGVVAGFGPGIRLDAVLVLPCVVLPFLFARPWRPRAAGLVLAGALPGLALLAYTNSLKFGSPNPFSYGNVFGETMLTLGLRAGAAAALALAAAWLLTRPALQPWVGRRRRTLAGVGLLVATVVVAAFPAARAIAWSAYAQLVDIRSYDPRLLDPWVQRSSNGGVVYFGAQKQALLQSLPYLVVLLLPALHLARGREPGGWREPGGALALLALVPAATVSYYAYWGYDGGLCLNMRLLLPALPFLSILVAYAGRALARRWGLSLGAPGWVVTVGLTAASFLALTRGPLTVDEQGFPYLVVPHILAAALLVLLAAGELLRAGLARTLARRAAWAALAASLSWAGLVGLLYDYPHHWLRREQNHALGGYALEKLPPDSILFASDFPDPFMRLVEGDRVRLAFPLEDGFGAFPALLEFHLRSGRRAFGAFRPSQWQYLRATLLRRYAVDPMWDLGDFVLAEISGPALSAR